MYKRMNEQLQKEGAMALVTGASSGIGLAYARELARRGYDLLLVSNEQERIGTVAEELAAAFGVIPMILSGSSMWSPLASIIAFGVVWSMFIAILSFSCDNN